MATTVTLKPNAIDISGSTSGTTTLQATAVAGTTTLTLPAATDTLVGRATTDTLTNKTLTGAAITSSTGAFTTLTSTGASSFATSSGDVGIGTNSPSAKLHIYKSSLPAELRIQSGDTQPTITFYSDAVQTPTRNWAISSSFAAYGDLCFLQSTALGGNPITAGTTRMTLNASGNLQASGTISVGNATPSASGAGITFPATQSASSDANTLDDYEEGTWTPGVSFGGGTTGITYTTQLGQYTKIGRQVTVTANVTLSSKGSSTGDATLTGLPFTNTTTRSVGSIYIASVTFADSPSILVEASNTIAYFRETTNAGVATDLTNADFANNSNWTATITYFV